MIGLVVAPCIVFMQFFAPSVGVLQAAQVLLEHESEMASVVKAARSKGITIAHCRVAFTESEIATTFGVDSPQAAFHPAVAPEDGDIVVRKHRVGPFFNAMQDVHAIFKERRIDTLLLGGVSTGGAVAATVVQAADLDYRLFVVEDSCADTSKETHEFLMKFFAKRATVIKSDELMTLAQ
ncbi:Isochorismatase-like protein [Lipomyces kononenkoae]|uniref:Isochorismatase-like protein n=1 Tax=Lipomyces kononenkoae TaxID=34357 RepID=A0ACC3STG8_LIPKO